MNFWKRFLGFDPNRQQAFPGQQSGETAELMTVFHWISLLPFFFKITLAVLALFLAHQVIGVFDDLPPLFRLSIVVFEVTLFLHLICFRLYNYFLKVLIITNYRVIDNRPTVFLKREREVIPLQSIQDIHFQQSGILPRLLKYGDLILLGTNSEMKYRFHNLPHVSALHHLLSEIHQKVTQKRS